MPDENTTFAAVTISLQDGVYRLAQESAPVPTISEVIQEMGSATMHFYDIIELQDGQLIRVHLVPLCSGTWPDQECSHPITHLVFGGERTPKMCTSCTVFEEEPQTLEAAATTLGRELVVIDRITYMRTLAQVSAVEQSLAQADLAAFCNPDLQEIWIQEVAPQRERALNVLLPLIASGEILEHKDAARRVALPHRETVTHLFENIREITGRDEIPTLEFLMDLLH